MAIRSTQTSGAIRRAKRAAFIEAFTHCGRVAHAARAAGIDRDTHYEWLKDPEYREQFSKAKNLAVARVEEEVLERAVHGIEQVRLDASDTPIIDPRTGRPYMQRVPSDDLLMFLLGALAPGKYRNVDA